MSKTLKNRIKSFMWRAGAFAVIAGLSYISGVGSLWSVDPKVLIDVTLMCFISLVIAEITKYLNTTQ